VVEIALAVQAVHKRRIRQIARCDGERERDRDRIRQGRCGHVCCCQHDARQDATYRRTDAREIVSRTKVAAVRLRNRRSKLCVETREAKLSLSWREPKRSGGS